MAEPKIFYQPLYTTGILKALATYALTGPGTITAPAITGTSTIGAGCTITSPTITGATISGGTNSDLKVLAASATLTSTVTLATLTGFSWTVAASGVYQFEINLPTTMTTSGGLSVALKYTTATMTAVQVQTYAATASDNTTAVSTQSTTTTDATLFFSSKTAAYTLVNLKGTLFVNAGGTVAVQVAQETSAGGGDVTVVLKGAYALLTRAS